MFIYNDVKGTNFLGIFTTATGGPALPGSPTAGQYAIELGTTDLFCICLSNNSWTKTKYLGIYTTLPTSGVSTNDVVGHLVDDVVTYKRYTGNNNNLWENLANNIFYHLSVDEA